MLDVFFLLSESHFALTDKTSHNPKIVHSILRLSRRLVSHTTKKQNLIQTIKDNNIFCLHCSFEEYI